MYPESRPLFRLFRHFRFCAQILNNLPMPCSQTTVSPSSSVSLNSAIILVRGDSVVVVLVVVVVVVVVLTVRVL